MEDDEEIQSHPSPGSGSPSSPEPNRRITVTVAAAASPQNTLTLALPIQQPRSAGSGGGSGAGGGGGGVGGGGGREDCWSEGATGVLIDAWGERYLELSRGNLKQKHWKEVADIVSSREDYSKTLKTDIQCKNRIDTVKKKYKLEKAKMAAGGGASKWCFFERLDQLIGSTGMKSATVGTSSAPLSKSLPTGIPVGVRSVPQFQKQHNLRTKQQLRRRPPADSESSESDQEPSRDSSDSFLQETFERKRARVQPMELNSNSARAIGTRSRLGRKDKDWGNSVRELTRAILKFGEAYEQAESSKLQQLVEMEKQRMKFSKDLELQRMQFFMKTQLELSQLKHRRGGNSNHHHSSNNNVSNNHSDSNN